MIKSINITDDWICESQNYYFEWWMSGKKNSYHIKYLYGIQEHKKLTYSNKSQNSDCMGAVKWGID